MVNSGKLCMLDLLKGSIVRALSYSTIDLLFELLTIGRALGSGLDPSPFRGFL